MRRLLNPGKLFLEAALKRGLLTEELVREISQAQRAMTDLNVHARPWDIVRRNEILSEDNIRLLLSDVGRGIEPAPGYRILGFEGEGATGIVYEALNLTNRGPVAFKILKPEAADKPDFVARFHWEIRAAARIVHDNVVRPQAVGTIDGLHYCTMEFVDGRTLIQKIREEGPLREEEALRIFGQLVAGLRALHAHDLVHRDINPGNVMISRSGVARICDVGLAGPRSWNRSIMTRWGFSLGAAHYIPPEQARGLMPEARSDIYSLGATLYFMLTGVPPFTGTTRREILMKHMNKAVPDPATRRFDVSPEPGRIIRKCMQKNPARRYVSAEALQNDLAMVRRPRWLVPAGAATAVLLLTAVIWMLIPAEAPEPALVRAPEPVRVQPKRLRPPVPPPVMEREKVPEPELTRAIEAPAAPAPKPDRREETWRILSEAEMHFLDKNWDSMEQALGRLPPEAGTEYADQIEAWRLVAQSQVREERRTDAANLRKMADAALEAGDWADAQLYYGRLRIEYGAPDVDDRLARCAKELTTRHEREAAYQLAMARVMLHAEAWTEAERYCGKILADYPGTAFVQRNEGMILAMRDRARERKNR